MERFGVFFAFGLLYCLWMNQDKVMLDLERIVDV